MIATHETEGYYVDFADDRWTRYARALAEGFAYQGEPSPFQNGEGRGVPSRHLPPVAFVDFLQNHDQVGNRAFGERLDVLATPAMVEALTAILLLSPHIPLMFMGEEWGETRPFAFFTDFEGELADPVREGRRREFAGFAAFEEPAAREAIPDPNAPGTFAASKIDWSRPETPEGAARLARTRRLLETRASEIVPLLRGAGGDAGKVLVAEDGALLVRWRLNGGTLTLRANLGVAPAALPAAPGRVIHTVGVDAAAPEAPPGSVVFAVDDGVSGRRPLRATYRLQFTPDFGFGTQRRSRPISRSSASATSTPRRSSRRGPAAPMATTASTHAPQSRARHRRGLRSDVLGLPGRGPGPDPRLRAEPHGHRRRSQPLLVEPAGMGTGEPLRPLVRRRLAEPLSGAGGRVLVPFLGTGLATALSDGALALRFDREEAAFAVWAHDTHKLPVRPADYAAILRAGGASELAERWEGAEEAGPGSPRIDELRAALRTASATLIEAALGAYAGTTGDPESWSALAALIDRQHWRPARFTADNEAINYRRFFTISELAGLRIEDPAVFEVVHRRLFELIAQGMPTGSASTMSTDCAIQRRISCACAPRLRRRCTFSLEILSADETLRDDWETDGTTGYEVANLLVGLFVNPRAEPELNACWSDTTRRTLPVDAEARIAKHEIMERALASEVDALVRRLRRLPEATAHDLGSRAIRAALTATIAAFDLYRTYADADGMTDADRGRVLGAVARARETTLGLDPAALELIEAVLTLKIDRPEAREIAFRAQQLTGPVMAKGFEDTALYRTTRLIALNEVGGAPDRFGIDIATFHAANLQRLNQEPRALLATSTHDTKRGEDARMRIAAISWLPDLWRQRVPLWRDLLAEAGAPEIDGNTLYFFLQLLLGVWPADATGSSALSGAELESLRSRVAAAMQKSVREAALHTRWTFGNPDYESRIERLVATALDPGGRFLASFSAAAAVFGRIAAANAIAQTVLKLTIPGTPDIYQGAELWDQSLVDPDNRRPVDFSARAAMLETADTVLAEGFSLTASYKLAVITRLLRLRRDQPTLFERGSYEPVRATGPEAHRICAFRRREGDRELLIAVALGWSGDAGDPLRRQNLPELAPAEDAIDPISASSSNTTFGNGPIFLRLR